MSNKIRRKRFAWWAAMVAVIASIMCGWWPCQWPMKYTVTTAFFIGVCTWMLATIVAYILWPDDTDRSYPKPKEWDKDYES